jgi:solute carrier family 25 phosphate transporter 3
MASGAQSTGSTKVDAVVQNIKAAEPKKLSGIDLYSRFALAGALGCSITHGALTPVDVYVCRRPQTSLPLYLRLGIEQWLTRAL